MLDAADSAGPLKVPVVHPDCKTTTIRRKLYKVLLCAEVSQLHHPAAFTPGTRRTLWMCLLDSHSTGDGEQQVVPLQNTLPLCTAGSSPPPVSPPLSGCLRWVWCNWTGAVTLLEELQRVCKTLWYRRWTRPAGSAALVFYILQQKMKKLDVEIFMFSVLRSSHEVITETGQTLKCLWDRVLFLDSSSECRHDSTDASVSAEFGHFGLIRLNTEIIHLFPVYHWVPWTQRGKSNDLMLYFLKDSLWDCVKLFIKQLEIILERGGCVIM